MDTTPIPEGWGSTSPDTKANTVPPPAPKKPAPRLTVVERITYERPDKDAVSVNAGFALVIVGDEQLYQRELRVGPNWTPLDTGWLGNSVSRVVLQNNANPKDDKAGTVRIGFGTGRPGPETVWGIDVPPGQSVTFQPAFCSRVFLSLAPFDDVDGTTPVPVTITAVPS